MNITIEPAESDEPATAHEGHWLCTPAGMAEPEVCMRARVPKSLPVAYGLLGRTRSGGYGVALRVMPGGDEEVLLALLEKLVSEARQRHLDRLSATMEFERMNALEIFSRAGLTVVSLFRHDGGAEVELRLAA